MWILSVCLICESLHTAWGLNQNFDSSSEWKREWRFDGMYSSVASAIYNSWCCLFWKFASISEFEMLIKTCALLCITFRSPLIVFWSIYNVAYFCCLYFPTASLPLEGTNTWIRISKRTFTPLLIRAAVCWLKKYTHKIARGPDNESEVRRVNKWC